MSGCVFCDALDEKLKKDKEAVWHPTIDYDKCIWCLKCFGFCKHWVYQIGENWKPFVAKPENCVPGCRWCENVCPEKAISH